MRYLLIQPTHRKFVRMLRERWNNGEPVLLKIEDVEDLNKLFRIGIMPATERHQRLYRIVLKAYNRSISEYTKEEKVRIVDDELIGFLERRFFIAEWKHLRMTMQSSFLVPFLRWLLKLLQRRNN